MRQTNCIVENGTGDLQLFVLPHNLRQTMNKKYQLDQATLAAGIMRELRSAHRWLLTYGCAVEVADTALAAWQREARRAMGTVKEPEGENE